jgi:hypothetical protein
VPGKPETSIPFQGTLSRGGTARLIELRGAHQDPADQQAEANHSYCRHRHYQSGLTGS